MSGWRTGGGDRIDRSRPINFRWAGRAYVGFAGDTLASALLANGVEIVGRSFKYHRPRGLMAAGLDEPNAIVQLETGAGAVPNLKATHVELYDGLSACPVNAWPSTAFDLRAANGWVKRFIPAAFYYKTFMWPNWHWFEPAIRRAAGLGVAPPAPDPDWYEHRFVHVDTLVVGGGASGVAAALAAARAGEHVMLVETEPVLGGGGSDPVAVTAAHSRIATFQRDMVAAGVAVMTRTTAFGFYDHGLVALCERLTAHVPPSDRAGPRERLWKVRAGRVLLATGAIERPLAFGNNDVPGIMLASAAEAYLARYGAVPGRAIVVATTGDSAYRAAFTLHDAGVAIVAIVDSRASSPHAEEAAQRGIRVIAEAAPWCANGRRALQAVTIGPLIGARGGETLVCDTLLVSGGWNPAVHLHSQSGGRLAFDTALQTFIPNDSPQHAVSVGAAAGIFDFAQAVESGERAGRGEDVVIPPGSAVGPTRNYADGDGDAHRAWLDFQNDVTVGDVQLAARENFRSVEHVKRYTTLGMASDQGKTSNVSGIRVLAGLLGTSPESIGTTKFRPPYDPITIGAFAGRMVGENLMPLMWTAAHDRHISAGAALEPYGAWLRPACYPRSREDEYAAVMREVRAVRSSVGLFDASPLGKIEVKGSDAANFLDRMYVGTVSSLKIGRCRYGLMLSEHGVVYDDGVFARIAEQHFLVGTTSSHAVAIAQRFQEWLQCEWPSLEVLTENVTTGWATMNVAGPQARAVLARVGTDVDLSSDAFSHMSFRTGRIGGVAARIQRVSFSGELSYEVSVPWHYGAALWDAIMAAGAKDDITPFGVEALMTMRIEKGFLHVGVDTDGTTLPQDLGFGDAIAKKSGDFVGRRSTMTSDGLRHDRRHFVGVDVADGGEAFTTGAHILAAKGSAPGLSDGWITSSVRSPTLGRPVALALVKSGRARIGERVRVWHDGNERVGQLVDPRAFDPEGLKLHG